MKRLIHFAVLAISLLACSQAFAQTVPDWKSGDLVKKGASIAVNGQVLDRAAATALVAKAGGVQLASDWDKAVSKRKLGMGLTIGGFSVATVGAVLGIGSALAGGMIGGVIGGIAGGGEGAEKGFEAGANNPAAIGSLVAAGLGAAAGVFGIVNLSSANSALNGIVDQCNSKGPGSPALSLAVGATPNGFGIALRF